MRFTQGGISLCQRDEMWASRRQDEDALVVTANLVTRILSVFYLLFSWEAVSTLERFAFMLVVALLVNIFVETGVLRFFFKTMNVRKLLLVSTVMNLASYALLIFWFLDVFASQLITG